MQNPDHADQSQPWRSRLLVRDGPTDKLFLASAFCTTCHQHVRTVQEPNQQEGMSCEEDARLMLFHVHGHDTRSAGHGHALELEPGAEIVIREVEIFSVSGLRVRPDAATVHFPKRRQEARNAP